MNGSELRLNLSCGGTFVPGWVNVDYSIGARIARWPVAGPFAKKFGLFNTSWDSRIFIHDLRRPLPWKDNSASVVYSSHTLEHLDRDAGAALLRECHRVLSPRGIIRIIVPDLRTVVDQYLARLLPAEDFVESLLVLRERPPNSLIKKLIWPYIGFPHQCMYDHEALIRVLTREGFDVSTRAYAESDISDITDIEIESRTVDAVVVEGRKRQGGSSWGSDQCTNSAFKLSD